jgi:hypothetical protein
LSLANAERSVKFRLHIQRVATGAFRPGLFIRSTLAPARRLHQLRVQRDLRVVGK